MEDFLDTLFMIGFWCGLAYLVAQMSKEKDIGFWTLFVTSFFLTPFVGLIMGLVVKRRDKQVDSNESNENKEGFLSRFMKKKEVNNEKTDLEMPDFSKTNNGSGM